MYNVKFIIASAVVATVLCALLISCGGEENSVRKPDGTNDTVSVADTTAQYEILTDTVGTTGVEVTSYTTSAEGVAQMIVTGGEVTLNPPDVTNIPEVVATGTTAPSKTEGDTTTTAKSEETKATAATTTTPLIQVMPNGEIVLPDDEWD